MAMDQILSNEDFKKMRKLDLTQRMEMRLGRKRKASEAVTRMPCAGIVTKRKLRRIPAGDGGSKRPSKL